MEPPASPQSQPTPPLAAAPEGFRLRGWDGLWLLAIFAIVALLHAVRLGNGDLWEHIKIGEVIVRHRGIPESRDFLWTWPGYPWLAHAWLFEVIVYALYRLAGLLPIYLFSIVLSASALALLFREWRRHGGSLLAGAWFTSLAAIAASPRYQLRPDACTALGLAILLVLLIQFRHGRRDSLWPLVILGLLWANLHGGVLTGMVALCAFAVSESVQFWLFCRRSPERALPAERLKHLWMATAAFVLTTFLTPHSWRLHHWSFGGTLSGFATQILEFMSFWTAYRSGFVSWIPNLALATSLISAVFLLARARRGVPLAAWVLLFLFTAWTLKMMRQEWPASLVIMAAALLALPHHSAPGAARWRPRWLAPAAWCIITAFVVSGVWHLWFSEAWAGEQVGIGENLELLPKGAADWLLANRPPGKLFNAYGDSYYLVFRLYPTYRLFIDGFADYPYELLTTHLAITDMPDPTPALDATGVGIVIVGPASCVYWEFPRRLETEDQWIAVYADGVSTVYLRNNPTYAPLIARFGYTAIRPAYAAPKPGADLALVLRDIARVEREGVPTSSLHAFLGLLLERAGDLKSAETHYRRAAATSAMALAPLRLAVLAQRRGDRAQAQRWLKRARGAIPAPLMADFLREASMPR